MPAKNASNITHRCHMGPLPQYPSALGTTVFRNALAASRSPIGRSRRSRRPRRNSKHPRTGWLRSRAGGGTFQAPL